MAFFSERQDVLTPWVQVRFFGKVELLRRFHVAVATHRPRGGNRAHSDVDGAR